MAKAIAALLFHGDMVPGGSAPARTRDDLNRLLRDRGLVLEIHAWIDDGGPDGEQLYCVADLVGQRLADDSLLATRAASIIRRDAAAETALSSLAEHCELAGYTDAAAWCLDGLAALQQGPVSRRSLISIGEQRSRPNSAISDPRQPCAGEF